MGKHCFIDKGGRADQVFSGAQTVSGHFNRILTRSMTRIQSWRRLCVPLRERREMRFYTRFLLISQTGLGCGDLLLWCVGLWKVCSILWARRSALILRHSRWVLMISEMLRWLLYDGFRQSLLLWRWHHWIRQWLPYKEQQVGSSWLCQKCSHEDQVLKAGAPSVKVSDGPWVWWVVSVRGRSVKAVRLNVLSVPCFLWSYRDSPVIGCST